jgi:hypothetical protein
MKHVVIGAHLRREDIGDLADAIAVGELFLSGLPVPDEQPMGDRDLLLRVAKVRAQLLETATFVAIRYGFAATSPAEALEKSAAHLARWKDLLERHREHVEIALKTSAPLPYKIPMPEDFTSGGDYLRALHASRRDSQADPALRNSVERNLLPLTSQHLWVHRDIKSIELVALVERARMEDVRRAGETLRAECPDIPFLLSGPWPLEVFADADHE